MAATRLIALHINKGKTVAQCLADRTDYSQNAAKTEDGKYISSYECDPKTADEEFLLTKRQYQHITGRQQKNDIIAYQIRQSFKPGEITPEEEALLKNTEESLFIGLAQIKPGNRIGDIGNAIEQFAKKNHLGVVKELCGHGVGTTVHESPDVPNYGKAGTGPLLREGMVIAVEPMLTLGSPSIYIEDNDWTVVTQDHSPSAHYEHTVVVTKDGYEILTGE